MLTSCCFAMLIMMPFRQVQPPSAVTDAAQADADFAVQGEYSGTLRMSDSDVKWGVQVIALGGGKFHAVAYPGGLPGDGWDKPRKIEGDGETAGDTTVIKSTEGSAVIKGEVLTILNASDVKLGDLKKVIRKSSTLGAKPPAGAVVLFDGTTPDQFAGGRIEDGLLLAGVTSKSTFQSLTLHLEFMTPYMPAARGQARGNSGCYLQGRYEVQILDSFGLAGKNNEAGGIYETRDPDVNMCFPPLSWQTYDIDYTTATFDHVGNKVSNARMTVRHNGTLVHDNADLPRATRAAPLKEGPEPGPIYLQDHGNPVRFRNIWLVPK